jgi:hypothetical protein
VFGIDHQSWCLQRRRRQAIDHIAKFITAQEKANLLPIWKMQLRATSFNLGEYERKLQEEGAASPGHIPVEHPSPEEECAEELSQREHRAFDVFSELKQDYRPMIPG